MYTVTARVMNGATVVGYQINTGDTLCVEDFKLYAMGGQIANCKVTGDQVTGVNGFQLKKLPTIQLSAASEEVYTAPMLDIFLALQPDTGAGPQYKILGVLTDTGRDGGSFAITLQEYIELEDHGVPIYDIAKRLQRWESLVGYLTAGQVIQTRQRQTITPIVGYEPKDGKDVTYFNRQALGIRSIVSDNLKEAIKSSIVALDAELQAKEMAELQSKVNLAKKPGILSRRAKHQVSGDTDVVGKRGLFGLFKRD